jgi:hypothetical protein
MSPRPFIVLAALVASLAAAAPPAPRLITEDLDRFWSAWDATGGKPDAATLERLYLAPGSPGLKDFLALRIGSAKKLAANIAAHPAYYAGLRRTTESLPQVSKDIVAALERMRVLYPKGELPPVYFVIGAMNSGGTTSDAGLLIGVDMYGKHPDTDLAGFGTWHRTVLAGPDLLPAIVVHELVHSLQPSARSSTTLLDAVLREGTADLVAEMAYGRHINAAAHAWGRANECVLWREFEPRMDGMDLKGFLYGGQAADRPADLGYFIGYRIGEVYRAKHGGEAASVAALIESKDSRALLAASGYSPCKG